MTEWMLARRTVILRTLLGHGLPCSLTAHCLRPTLTPFSLATTSCFLPSFCTWAHTALTSALLPVTAEARWVPSSPRPRSLAQVPVRIQSYKPAKLHLKLLRRQLHYDMFKQLGMCATLAEGLSSGLSTHLRWLTTTSNSRGSSALFWPLWALHSCVQPPPIYVSTHN